LWDNGVFSGFMIVTNEVLILSDYVDGALVLWSRRSLATLEDRSLIPGGGNNNVLVTRSIWPTMIIVVSSVYYTSLVSANKGTHYITIHSDDGSTIPC